MIRPLRFLPQVTFIQAFLKHEASGGIVLMAMALLALAVANSPLAPLYFGALAYHAGGLSVLHWINDALMALFFLLVGLELKRELTCGELATWKQRGLPGLAALGGMAVPALIFVSCNLGADGQPHGWAIPAATDIAFALGVLSLLGSRVPVSLKVFLTALAIIDDLGAVLIIALFYTADLNLTALAGVGAMAAVLAIMNRAGVARVWLYLVPGAVLWLFMLKSGVHATLAGVALAFAIPATPSRGETERSPLHRLEHGLHPWVTYLIVPVFGLANAGVSLIGVSAATLGAPVPLGTALGLFIGKQIGVFAFAWIAIRVGLAALPRGAGWAQLYGVALLCGIGFTMSLFIGLLAFADSAAMQDQAKLGVLLGSVLSALAGAAVLRMAGKA